MSEDKRHPAFDALIGTAKPHEVAERLAEEFHKDMKSCLIFKLEGRAQVNGHLKKPMFREEFIERTKKAMEG